MSTRKHVNLDMDVHLKLTKQRRRSGLTIKAIANAILRCALSNGQLFRETIGDVLIEKGYITSEEFAEVTEQAHRRARTNAEPDCDAFMQRSDGAYSAGSWMIRTVHACPDNSYQVLKASARDARKRPTRFHVHEVSETVLVLSGHVAVHLEDRLELLDPLDSTSIPQGVAHSLTPLTADTVLSVTLVPGSKAFQHTAPQTGATRSDPCE